MNLHLLETARGYVATGLSVIPIGSLSKLPDLPGESWRTYTERFPTDDELVAWFAEAKPHYRIGIVTGPISGGLVVLDVDRPHVLELWRQAVDASEQWRSLRMTHPELLSSRILPVVKTERGHHIYFRTSLAVGTHLLAGLSNHPLVETRGLGGYVVAPPSTFGVDRLGPAYFAIEGMLVAIPEVPSEVAQVLIEAGKLERFYQATVWNYTQNIDVAVLPDGDVTIRPHEAWTDTLRLGQAAIDYPNLAGPLGDRLKFGQAMLEHVAAIRPLADHNREATNMATAPSYDDLDYDPLDDYVGDRTHE